jgi:hypothetical protein
MRLALCSALCVVLDAQTPPPGAPNQSRQNSGQGTLSGKLTGIAPGHTAILILTNLNNGSPQRITVSSDGTFSVSLPPGTYRVEVERDGFRQTAQQNIDVETGAARQLNITLQGGPTIEAVEVNATAPAADTTPPEIGLGYTTTTVRTVPVFDRNYQELIGQMTGITPPVSSYPLTFDPQGNRQFNTNGLPSYTNDQLSDGTSIREPYTGNLAVRVIPDEAIQQLNVVTSNYPARTGFAAGTVDNVFPRPGTNGLHGSLFGFGTDDFFRVRDPFNPVGNPEPTIHDRQFGGTIGGAIIPDRMFFFGSYQGTIDDGSALQFATVPTAAELGGNFSGLGTPIYNPLTGATGGNVGTGRVPFAGGIIPATGINPIAAAYLSFLPAANVAGATANNLAQNAHFFDRSQVADGKIDYHFTNDWTGFLKYGWSGYNARQDSIFGPYLGGSTLDTLRNDHAVASVAGNYHGVIAELRLGYSRYRNYIQPSGTDGPLASQLSGLGFMPSGSTTIPNVSIEGLGSLGTPLNVPAMDIDNNYEGEANFHVYRGRNQFYFGADVRNLRTSGFPNFLLGSAGSFSFGPGPVSSAGANLTPGTDFGASLASFLVGAPQTSGIFNPAYTPFYSQWRYGGFIGDTIRMNRLTIDLSGRYELYSPIDLRGSSQAFQFNPATGATTPTGSLGAYHYLNIQPRVGLAFRITDNTVVRTSYAIYEFPLPFSLQPVNFAGTGTSFGLSGSYGLSPFAVPSVTSGATNVPYYVNSLNRDPYVQSYYFGIQQSAPWGFLLNAAYVGNLGRELPYIRQINAAAPGTGVAGLPLAGIGVTAPVFEEGNGLTSNYNALQATLTKRLSKGASFNVAYTWSKAMDYGTNLINPFNTAANYAAADWDRTQMLTISHVFDIPIGEGTNRWNQGVVAKILGDWKLNGLFHWATGTPYNVFASPLACACPNIPAVYATAAAGANTHINGQASFNPAIFALPGANSFGTLGRNAVRGPDFTEYNLSLFKTIPMAENREIEFRAEAYNLLNSTQYGNPYNSASLGNFGQVNNVTLLNGLYGGGPRTFVLGLRILF